MGDGRPRLLFLGSPDELAGARARRHGHRADGVRQRGRDGGLPGAVPAPRRSSWSIGRSPAVHDARRARRARSAGTSRSSTTAATPTSTRIPSSCAPRSTCGLGIGPSTAIVVATQGHYDDLALEAALATDAGYIGRRRRREARRRRSLELLRDEGIDDDAARAGARARRARPRAGRQRRDRGRGARRPRRPPRRRPARARRRARCPTAPKPIDPVCGMTVFVDDAKHHATHDGADYWFCSATCQREVQPSLERTCVSTPRYARPIDAISILTPRSNQCPGAVARHASMAWRPASYPSSTSRSNALKSPML